MSAAASITYLPGGLQPTRDCLNALTDNVVVAPGYYAQGTILGQFTATTAASEVQTLTFTGTPTGGTYRVTLNGVISDPITYSTTVATHAANFQAALNAMTNVGSGNATAVCTVSGTVMTVTFGGTLANQNIPLFTFTANSLTGGTSPTATWAETTAGSPVGVNYGAYDDSLSNGLQSAKRIVKYNTTVNLDGTVQSQALGYGVSQARGVIVYTRGTFYTATPAGVLALPGLDANGVTDLGKLVTGTTLTSFGTELLMIG